MAKERRRLDGGVAEADGDGGSPTPSAPGPMASEPAMRLAMATDVGTIEASIVDGGADGRNTPSSHATTSVAASAASRIPATRRPRLLVGAGRGSTAAKRRRSRVDSSRRGPAGSPRESARSPSRAQSPATSARARSKRGVEPFASRRSKCSAA